MSTDPQIVCQGSACTTLPIPPFVPAPQPAPNNVLELAVKDPSCSTGFLRTAIVNYQSGIQFRNYPPPIRIRVGECFAEVFGCNEFQYGAAWDESIYGPPDPFNNHMQDSALVLARTQYDSNPNYDQQLLDGTLDCSSPLVVTAPVNPPPPPPPPTGWCQPPGVIITNPNGGLVCQFDPPTPTNLPMGIAPLRVQRPAKLEPPALKRALNPTIRPGMPVILKYCACNDGAPDEEIETVA